jgi:multidrug efflux pump subunit AcrA (membrane-fusion protein)
MRSRSHRLALECIRLASGALAGSALLFGCSTTGPASPSAAPAPAPATTRHTEAADEKIQIRNNASSLLEQLLDEEKNVSKVLIIKHGSRELSGLIKAISTAAADGAKRLKALAQDDPTLDLRRQELPVGEKACRDAISKTEEYDLLLSSGADFEFTLLLTQAQALNYGSHLAKVAANNSADPKEVDALLAMSRTLDQLLTQVKAMMKSPPSK